MAWLALGASALALAALAGVLLLRSRLSATRAEQAVARQAATEANEKRRLAEAAIEHADELVGVVSPAGRVEYVNEALCRALGGDAATIAGAEARTLFADESWGRLGDLLEQARGGTPWHGTLVHRRRDGTTFPAAATVVLVGRADGAGECLVLVARDITEESRLRDQLIHTERLSAVGQLVSGVAHELNNPLQSILGFTELLIETEERETRRRDLRQIRAEAVRAGKIIRNLLAFVRRSSAERVLHNVNDLARATLALRAYEFGSANITLREDYAENLPPVWVNREEIQQILLNLVLNAEQAMRAAHRGGTLSVRSSLAGGHVVVDVQDSGPGVPPGLAGRVFEPFFSTKEVGEGTGLGLSIALGIAEAHGGLLSLVPVTSGACFRLALPASWPAEPGDDPADAVVRVLVASDEPGLRGDLQRLLSARGLSVDLAADGDGALALLGQHRYDRLFCDVRLPQMGGLALYTRVTDEYSALARGFAFVTDGHLDPDSQATIDRSPVPVLARPFSPAELDAVLAQLAGAAEDATREALRTKT